MDGVGVLPQAAQVLHLNNCVEYNLLVHSNNQEEDESDAEENERRAGDAIKIQNEASKGALIWNSIILFIGIRYLFEYTCRRNQ